MAKTSAVNATAAGAWQYGNAAGDAFAKEDVQNLGANYDLHDHSANKNLAVSRLATSVTLTATTTFTGFGLTLAAGSLTLGTTPAASGLVRLPNGAGGTTNFIGWRNAANSADLMLGYDSSNRLYTDSVTAATATLGGAVLPASPAGFISMNVSGTLVKVAFYNP